MTYSLDLRQRVVDFVKNGGSKAEASRVYEVSEWCVYEWCKRIELKPKKPPQRRKRKLDWEALHRHVQKYPDALLRERAEYFEVHINAIWYACKQMKLTSKKNITLQAEESLQTN
jgi:transposase